MKRIKKSQMLFVQGHSGEEFQERYNSAINSLAQEGIAVDEKMISIETMSAVILYTRTEEYPENLKDEYALQGIYPTCESCPHFEFFTDISGHCPFLRIRGASGTHYANFDICDTRWREIEEELKDRQERRSYDTTPELRGRTCEGRHKQGAVCACAGR